MYELEIIKPVPGSVHPRRWQIGDSPTVSKSLADRLVKEGYAIIKGLGDTRRGITQDELDQLEAAQEQAQNAKKGRKKKIIVPAGMEGNDQE